MQYNSIDFGKKAFRSVTVRAKSQTGGTIQIRIKDASGPVVAEVNIPKGKDWSLHPSRLSLRPPAVNNLFVTLKDKGRVEADWIRFE